MEKSRTKARRAGMIMRKRKLSVWRKRWTRSTQIIPKRRSTSKVWDASALAATDVVDENGDSG